MLLIVPAFACPPTVVAVGGVSDDGSAHVLAADTTQVCWWILDESGDARVGARWERAKRHPEAIAALADGRVALVLTDGARWQLGIRDEAGELRLKQDLPGAPDQLVADPARPSVTLAWTVPGVVWTVDADTLEVTVSSGSDGAPR